MSLRDWYSAQELVDMKLSGLPATKKGLLEKAERENWIKQKRSGRGGGFEYARTSLPKEAQLQLLATTSPAAPIKAVEHSVVQAQTSINIESMDEHQRRVMLARENIINFVSSYTGSVESALAWINNQYSLGLLSANLTYSIENAWDKPRADMLLTRSTYNKWVAAKKSRGIAAPLKVQKDLTLKPWHQLAIELKTRPQGSCMRWLHEELEKQYPAVSYGQVQRFFADKFSAIDQLKGRYTGSQLRSHTFYQHRTSAGLLPGDEVHADGWNSHFTAPHHVTGEYVTYEIWHFHDVATRFVTRPGIGYTENFEVIAKGLENFIAQLGVPAVLQTDSTKVIRGSSRFTKDPITSIEEIIGITITHPKEVGNSQANGIAENFNSSWLDKRGKDLATYQHDSMDSLTFKRVKKITADMVRAANKGDVAARESAKKQLQRQGKGIVFESYKQAIDWINQIIDEFNDRPHRSLPKVRCPIKGTMRHQTPKEALQQHITQGWTPTWLGGTKEIQKTLLVDAFRPRIIKKVTRETVTPYGGMRYHHQDLGHWEGKEVVVIYDIADYDHVWVTEKNGNVICQAEFVAATGYRAKTATEDAQEKRAQAQIRLRQRQIERIQARTPHLVVEAERQPSIVDFVPAAKPIDAELVAFSDYQDKSKEEELGSFQDTVMQLYGADEDEADEEVAAS